MIRSAHSMRAYLKILEPGGYSPTPSPSPRPLPWGEGATAPGLLLASVSGS